MNVNLRLSTTACFLLMTFSAVFATGFEYGKNYATQTMPRPIQEGVVCPPQSNIASTPAKSLERLGTL
jgi:hypothetical protein